MNLLSTPGTCSTSLIKSRLHYPTATIFEDIVLSSFFESFFFADHSKELEFTDII
jgi:hypothetical protein